MRKDGLTRRNIAFCDRFIAGGLVDASKAYQEAYPKASVRTAQNNASSLLADTRIKAYIDKAIASLPATKTVSVEFVIAGIKNLALTATREADRIHAYELLGKYLKIFKETEVTQNILTVDDLKAIRHSVSSFTVNPDPALVPDTSPSPEVNTHG